MPRDLPKRSFRLRSGCNHPLRRTAQGKSRRTRRYCNDPRISHQSTRRIERPRSRACGELKRRRRLLKSSFCTLASWRHGSGLPKGVGRYPHRFIAQAWCCLSFSFLEHNSSVPFFAHVHCIFLFLLAGLEEHSEKGLGMGKGRGVFASKDTPHQRTLGRGEKNRSQFASDLAADRLNALIAVISSTNDSNNQQTSSPC